MSGFQGLFIPGPTNMPFGIRQAMDVPLEDQRAPDFPAFTLPLFRALKRVFRTETGQIFLFPSSGTGGWEAAHQHTVARRQGADRRVRPVLAPVGRLVPASRVRC